MWLMKTLLTSGCTNQRGAGQSGQFSKGNVQSVLDRIAVLAAQFDDDGEMDVWGFGEKHKKYPNVTLDNLDTYMGFEGQRCKKTR